MIVQWRAWDGGGSVPTTVLQSSMTLLLGHVKIETVQGTVDVKQMGDAAKRKGCAPAIMGKMFKL